MKHEFIDYLGALNEQAARPPEEQEDPAVEAEIARLQKSRVEQTQGDEQWQEEIYLKQLDKQAVMLGLAKAISLLDTPTEQRRFEKSRHVKVTGSESGFCTEHSEPLTLGDILLGSEWQRSFALDPATVPRAVRKKYLVEEAKHELRELTDWQIYFDETSSKKTPSDTKEAFYEAVELGSERQQSGQELGGVLLERLVRTLMQKLSIDHDLAYQALPADVFQDVVQKIDFIITRDENRLGVRVEQNGSQGPKDIGVQVTANTTPEKIAFKQGQLEQVRESIRRFRGGHEVDDIVLATFYENHSRPLLDAVRTWQEKGSAATPDTFVPMELKAQIFRSLLSKSRVLSAGEIEDQWAAVVLAGS